MSRTFFAVLFTIMTALDLFLAGMAIRKGARGKQLALCLLCAGFVSVTYMASVLVGDYFTMSLFSSLYFFGTDLTVIALLFYTHMFVNSFEKAAPKRWMFALAIYGILDALVMLVNPFWEIVVSYIPSGSTLVGWAYEQHFLHYVHMAYSYLMVALSLLILLRKMQSVSSLYRGRYRAQVVGLVVVVVVNITFVFLKVNPFDNSIICYTILGAFFYLNDFHYSGRHITGLAQKMVLEDMGHPVILFNNDNQLALCNSDANVILPAEKQKPTYHLESFLADLGADPALATAKEDVSFQWNPRSGMVYRCDFHPLYDRKGGSVGRLFVFTENSLEVDLLTGFSSKAAAANYFAKPENFPALPACVIVCDINRLSRINLVYGTETGDTAIRKLADILRKYCPEGSVLARMDEANLVAVCPATSAPEARRIARLVTTDFETQSDFLFSPRLQSSIGQIEAADSVSDVVRRTLNSLKARKMLDASSAHASLLASLAQAQTEGDSETEAHVQRTRYMGDKLGRRLGLSDGELNDLSLLCLLHDIGKLGIPLEILNKPDALRDDEWAVMKTHVDKGYRIAMASDELQSIASLILRHHECWDGSGYPDGLKGEEIPLLSRIIAIVDAYDAMTNDRPYRKGLPGGVAASELKRCAGKQFDPTLVDTFLQMLKEEFGTTEFTEETGDRIAKKPFGVEPARDDSGENGMVRVVPYARYCLDKNHKILSINEAFTALTGYTEEDLKTYDMHQNDLIPRENVESYQRMVQSQLAERYAACLEHEVRRKDGSRINVFCFGRSYFDAVARDMRFEIVFSEIRDGHACAPGGRGEVREMQKKSFSAG